MDYLKAIFFYNGDVCRRYLVNKMVPDDHDCHRHVVLDLSTSLNLLFQITLNSYLLNTELFVTQSEILTFHFGLYIFFIINFYFGAYLVYFKQTFLSYVSHLTQFIKKHTIQ